MKANPIRCLFQDVVREGLGGRVPPAGRHQHAMLDRNSPSRPAAMAGQGAHPDGRPNRPHLICVMSRAQEQHPPTHPSPTPTPIHTLPAPFPHPLIQSRCFFSFLSLSEFAHPSLGIHSNPHPSFASPYPLIHSCLLLPLLFSSLILIHFSQLPPPPPPPLCLSASTLYCILLFLIIFCIF